MRRHDNAFPTLSCILLKLKRSCNTHQTFSLSDNTILSILVRVWLGSKNLRAPILYPCYFCDYMFKAIKDPQFCIAIPLYHEQGIFNYITTETFTPVGPLLVPLVKRYFQMSWALSITTKKSSLLKKLHLRAFSCPLTISAFHLIESQHSIVFRYA
jgi:hypothetical protein